VSENKVFRNIFGIKEDGSSEYYIMWDFLIHTGHLVVYGGYNGLEMELE
jgi:hypothetical protein